MLKTLTVRWDDFEAAFIIGAPGSRYFLSLRTGDVEYTSFMDGETVKSRVLKRTSGDGWLEIPRASTDEAMAEIQAFIETEPDAELRAAMQAGIESKHPLKGFNRALGANVEPRRRWAAARMRGIHDRLLAFCAAHELAIDDDRFRALADS